MRYYHDLRSYWQLMAFGEGRVSGVESTPVFYQKVPHLYTSVDSLSVLRKREGM